jgi:hypothetical protein
MFVVVAVVVAVVRLVGTILAHCVLSKKGKTERSPVLAAAFQHQLQNCERHVVSAAATGKSHV